MNLLLIIALTVFCHAAFHGVRVTVSLYALNNGSSALTVGMLMALSAAFPTLFGVAAGRWTDRVGTRRPMLFGSTLVMIGAALPALLPDVRTLFLTAALNGTGMMALQVSLQNAVGEMSKIEERATNFSHMALGMSISSFAGPLIAGFGIDQIGYRATFAVLAALPLICLLGLGLDKVQLPPPSPHAGLHGNRNVFDLLKKKELRRVYLASFLLAMGWDLHTFFVPIIGTERGLTASQIGITLASFALATFVIRLAMRWIARRFREWQVLTSVMFLAGATFLLFPFVTTGWQLMTLSFTLGLGLGAAQPMVMALMHHSTPEGRVGEALGLRTTLMNGGQVALPLLFGALGATVGLTTVFWAAAAGLGAGGYFSRK
ncbi:MAG: MFS transporter [Casimicrobiaceae bacterium]